MKLRLNFNSEQEFQNFCSQLFSAEFSLYQAIEGSGGDKGFDGLDQNTVYQIFFPDIKNRIKSKYIKKIDEDLEKMQKTIKKNKLNIKLWVFVVPEDLSTDLIIYLQKQSQRIGIKCISWGASKLTELLGKHPHIRKSFPSVFSKDLEEELKRLSEEINNLSKPSVTVSGIAIIKDVDYIEQKAKINQEFTNKAQGSQIKFGASSASRAAIEIFHRELVKKMVELNRKKGESDRMYELEKQDIKAQFEELIQKKRDEFAVRGLSGSGLEKKAIGLILIRENSELEKLKLKYGKK